MQVVNACTPMVVHSSHGFWMRLKELSRLQGGWQHILKLGRVEAMQWQQIQVQLSPNGSK